MSGRVQAINKNINASVVASKENGVKVNADKTKHMVIFRDQSAGRNHFIKTDSSIDRLEQFKYFATTPTNQNSIQEEIKSRLKSGNGRYHSVQNLSSSCLVSKNIKIKIYRIIILPVVSCGCGTLSLSFREELC